MNNEIMNFVSILITVANSDENNEIICESEVGTHPVSEAMLLRASKDESFNYKDYGVANDGKIIFRCEDAIADLKTDYAEML